MGSLQLKASIRLLIVDDQTTVVRPGFSCVLRSQAGLNVVGFGGKRRGGLDVS